MSEHPVERTAKTASICSTISVEKDWIRVRISATVNKRTSSERSTLSCGEHSKPSPHSKRRCHCLRTKRHSFIENWNNGIQHAFRISVSAKLIKIATIDQHREKMPYCKKMLQRLSRRDFAWLGSVTDDHDKTPHKSFQENGFTAHDLSKGHVFHPCLQTAITICMVNQERVLYVCLQTSQSPFLHIWLLLAQALHHSLKIRLAEDEIFSRGIDHRRFFLDALFPRIRLLVGGRSVLLVLLQSASRRGTLLQFPPQGIDSCRHLDDRVSFRYHRHLSFLRSAMATEAERVSPVLRIRTYDGLDYFSVKRCVVSALALILSVLAVLSRWGHGWHRRALRHVSPGHHPHACPSPRPSWTTCTS